MTQFFFLKKDVKRMLGKHSFRIMYIWTTQIFVGVFLYRVERGFYLLLGKKYKFIRILFLPIINICKAYSNIDIHYLANIKGGLLILHSSVGIVISGQSIIGENLTLTGGNIIGVKANCEIGAFTIGNNCVLGANATIIGPLNLSNRITIGASACVVSSLNIDNSILVGVPAKAI